MLLAIDVGNSNISLGLYEAPDWVRRWRVQTAQEKTADEYSVLFRHLLTGADLEPSGIDRVVLSSVVPPLTGTISTMIDLETHVAPLIVGPSVETGLRISTDNPAEVGTDLVANAVAAYEQFRQSCIVVDFGTALTFTAVSGSGELLGAAIAPGLRYAVEALAEHTAQLPRVQLVPPETVIGKNTAHSIQAGVIYGYVGMVESLIHRMDGELGGGAKVVAIGGQAQIIASLTSRFDAIEPWLTIEGLRIIAERNA